MVDYYWCKKQKMSKINTDKVIAKIFNAMRYKKHSIAFGFTIWLVATLVFRFWENSFFFIDNSTVITSLFIGTIPVLYFLIKWFFSKYKLRENEMTQSVILMSIPGMILDVFAIKYHDLVFPTMTNQEIIVLASWVIWAYVIVLLIGLLSKEKRR